MKPWFGPKWIGWGIGPVSWEGWLATALLIAALVALTHAPGVSATGVNVGALVLVLTYFAVSALTAGPRGTLLEPNVRVAAVWLAYLAGISVVSAWGWGRLADGPLPVHWSFDGTADRFAPGARVLLGAPLAAGIVVTALSVLTSAGRRPGAMAASVVLLSGLLLLHLAYVAVQMGVLT